MLKALWKQTVAENWLEKGKAVAGVAGVGRMEVLGTGARIWLYPFGRFWKVLLQPHCGELLGLEEDFRSQCFLLKTGMSAKAENRWSLMRALV